MIRPFSNRYYYLHKHSSIVYWRSQDTNIDNHLQQQQHTPTKSKAFCYKGKKIELAQHNICIRAASYLSRQDLKLKYIGRKRNRNLKRKLHDQTIRQQIHIKGQRVLEVHLARISQHAEFILWKWLLYIPVIEKKSYFRCNVRNIAHCVS